MINPLVEWFSLRVKAESISNNNFTARLHLNGRYNRGKLYTFFFMFVNYWADGTRLYEGKTTGIHNLHLTEYLQNTRIPLAPVDAQERFEQFARQSDKSKQSEY